MLRRVDSEETRKILRQVNEQQSAQRTFKVTYVYRTGARNSATISHMHKGADKRSVYREFCRLRASDGLLDFMVQGTQEGAHTGGDTLLAFPARNVYRIYIEEAGKT